MPPSARHFAPDVEEFVRERHRDLSERRRRSAGAFSPLAALAIAGGAVGAAAMMGTGAAYVERASRVDGLAAAAGVPFTAWVAFATVLGEEIRRRNPS